MHYQEFWEDDFPIGSGTVKSGIKQFKARLSGPGMQWFILEAARMLALHSTVMGDIFDELWAVE